MSFLLVENLRASYAAAKRFQGLISAFPRAKSPRLWGATEWENLPRLKPFAG